MLKFIVLVSFIFSVTAQAAAPVVFQAKTLVAMLSDAKVINALPGGYIYELKYRDDLSPFSHEILSRDAANSKVCTTSALMKIINADVWNPEYGVDTVGATVCN